MLYLKQSDLDKIYALLVILILTLGAYLVMRATRDTGKPFVIVTAPRLAFDSAEPREVAGYYPDIFAGRVKALLGTDTVNGEVVTRYSITVFKTLKGKATGTVKVTQQGGYLDGTWHIVGPTMAADLNVNARRPDDAIIHGYLLERKKTYLFIGTFSKFSGTYELAPLPAARALLDISEILPMADAQRWLEADNRVRATVQYIATQIRPATVKK
ncbi:MAG: hypothetical protein RLZZ324_923 [Candidatus Parcubacteria bacterium]|jgi:hypothetical protein